MTSSSQAADRSAIEALVVELDAAASARDVERFLALFVDGPDFAFGFNGVIRTSRDEVRSFHESAWSGIRELAFHTAVQRLAFPATDVATLCATGRSARTLVTGERSTGTYALMLAIVRKPEGWRVLQAHESTPASPGVFAVGD
jgi:uncharacterized protein (TIGR02246 family)